MKNVGFIISHKENEKRRAITINDIDKIKHKDHIFIEKGYGEVLSCTDEDYISKGVHVVSRQEALQKDIICAPKT